MNNAEYNILSWIVLCDGMDVQNGSVGLPLDLKFYIVRKFARDKVP